MPLAFRGVRLDRWDPETMQAPTWLPAGDIVADTLSDLRTSGGALSVWHIEADRSNLQRVLVAFATTRELLTNVDFVLFDQELLANIGVQVAKTRGESPDEIANAEWHREIMQISGHRLVELAKNVMRHGAMDCVLRGELQDMVKKAVIAKQIDPAKLNRKMRKEIDGLVGKQPQPDRNG